MGHQYKCSCSVWEGTVQVEARLGKWAKQETLNNIGIRHRFTEAMLVWGKMQINKGNRQEKPRWVLATLGDNAN